MKKIIVFFILTLSLSFLIFAQGKGPREVYLEYVNADNFFTAKRLTAEKLLKQFEDMEAKHGKNVNMIYIMLRKVALPNKDVFTIENIEIQGDSAVLHAKSTAFVGKPEEHEFTGTVYFKKISNEWKIIKDVWKP